MPVARYQLPDGRIARFEVPEGTTPEQAQSMMRDFDFGVMDQQQAAPPTSQQSVARTALDQGLQGATFGFADEVTDRIGAGIASVATGEKFGDLLNEARGMSKDRMSQQMEQNPGTAIAANIGGALLTGGAGATTKTGTAAANMLRTGGLTARIGKGALAGATSGALYGAGASDDGKRLEGAQQGAVLGGVVGGAIPAAGAALGKAKEAVVPVVDDALKPLASRAKELGIPLRVDQISPTRFRKTVQKVSQELPLSGADKFDDIQHTAFNKAIAKTIGQEADDLSPEVINRFLDKSSKRFGLILDGKPVALDAAAKQQLDDIVLAADETLTADVADIVRKNIDKLGDDFTLGNISGEKLANFRSQLIKRIPKADSGARQYLTDVVDVIDDVAARGLSPKQAQLLQETRRQWRNYKTIEPLLEKATDGKINPVNLMQRVASSPYIKASRKSVGEDDLVDLARIGKEFLPKLGGSDTAQKIGLGAAGASALFDPTAGAAIMGGLGANRAFQSGYNTSQRVVDSALKATRSTPKSGMLSAPAGAAAGAISGAESQAIRPTLSTPIPKSQPRADSGNFDSSVNFVMDIEGGYVPDDAGRGPTNMGVNASANPDLDIKNLTPEKAKEVYRKRYWSAIEADKMPPEMALVAFDAAVNHGVGKAKRLIHEAKGDPMKLLQLREMEYARLVKANPQKYVQYAGGWIDRLNKLQAAIA